ncbi:MAG: hypothetical protein R3183_14295 [Oleiphilaceae bacterium]|nr:hypothetical protein [Oleiphilaceae bacterium]
MAQPDIEIYVKNVALPQLLAWIGQHFELPEPSDTWEKRFTLGKTIHMELVRQQQTIPLMITPNAAGKAFTSIWFKSSHTPWSDDLSCGRECAQVLELEVRCSAAGWQEEEALDSEQWWVIKDGQERQVRWG